VKAAQRTVVEQRVYLEAQRDRVKWPVVMEMIDALVDEKWLGGETYHWPEDRNNSVWQDLAGALLRTAMCFDTVARGANWATTKARTAILVDEFRWQVGVGEPNSDGSYSGYEEVKGEDITALLDKAEEEGRYQLMVDKMDAINLDF
jgi:hypothetical protein